MFYKPGYTLSDALYGLLEDEWNDYLNYWGFQNEKDFTPDLDDVDRQLMHSLDKFGKALARGIHSLTVGPEIRKTLGGVLDALIELHKETGEHEASRLETGTRAVRKEVTLAGFVRSLHKQTVVQDCVSMQLGFEATGRLLPRAEKRIERLITMIALRDLSELTLAYLDRATRLYLWGFDPECLVMCGAVLEAALEDSLPDEAVWALGFAKNGDDYTLCQRINAAAAGRLFSSKHRALAHGLRQARNDTLHGAPNISLSADQAIRHLASLLDVLFPDAEAQTA